MDGRFFKGANHLVSSEWQEIQEHIERMLDSLKYGSITLVVQDGKIVQIEKNEKVRLQSNRIR
ncbi:YezD family protein [Bacillus sp. sid0103]|nr:YezD family protein [Bacillus sp. sid0103]